MIGRKLANYEIVAKVGEGGMAEVCRENGFEATVSFRHPPWYIIRVLLRTCQMAARLRIGSVMRARSRPVPARRWVRFAIRCALALGLVVVLPSPSSADADWNDSGVQWRPWAKALDEAQRAGKPICLVFYTTWCRHCRAYSHVFHDGRVVEASHRFVMVRVDADREPELSDQYALDGDYIPRTYFLSPDGTPDAGIQGPWKEFKYFYDEADPASLLSGMRAAARLAPRVRVIRMGSEGGSPAPE